MLKIRNIADNQCNKNTNKSKNTKIQQRNEFIKKPQNFAVFLSNENILFESFFV